MTSIPAREVLVPGDEIAHRYHILEFLGRGGVGDVYRVRDLELDVEVALKRLRPEVARHGETLKRFRHEVVLARRLQGRNVARIFDLGLDGDTLFITMEYLPGPSLAILMAEQAPFPVSEVLSMGQQICEAVGEAHAVGIVHRDIKPQNILFDSTGRMKVTDFGMAYAPDVSGDTTSGSLLGTPQYMSPEQAEGLPVDPRSDVYAIGLILYELFTGVFPFSSHNPVTSLVQRLRKRPVSMRTYSIKIPHSVDSLVERCLERDVRKRPEDASELGRLLQVCSTHERSAVNGVNRWKWRVSAFIIFLISAISAITLVLFFMTGRADPLIGRPIVVTASPSDLSRGYAEFMGGVLSTLVNVPVSIRESGDAFRDPNAVELHAGVVGGADPLSLIITVITTDTLHTCTTNTTQGDSIDPGELIRRCRDMLTADTDEIASRVPRRTDSRVFVNLLEGLVHNDTARIRMAAAGDESCPWSHYFLAKMFLRDAPESARASLKRAAAKGLHLSAVKAVEYRIASGTRSMEDVILQTVRETDSLTKSFAEKTAIMEAAIQSGYSATSAIIVSDAPRITSKGYIGRLFAARDLLRGNAQSALNWCSVVRRHSGPTPAGMKYEALARIYLGQPERAAAVSRELLRINPTEDAYGLLAEAAIRQREIPHAYEITAEGLSRFNDSVLLKHLQNLVNLGLNDGNDMVDPHDSSFLNGSDSLNDRLIRIMYSAQFLPFRCEKIWWDIVPRYARRPEVWLAGAWIARFAHDSSVAMHRLRRAMRMGITEDAVQQDIRFTGVYTGT